MIRKILFVLFCVFLGFMLVGCSDEVSPTPPGPQPDTREIIYWGNRTISSAETVASKIIYLTGSLTIESGGSLALDYVKLCLSCEAPAQYGIFVNYGGALTATNGSQITAYRTSEGYSFWFKSGSSGQIKNSTVEASWTPSPEGKSQFSEAGLFVEAADFKVISSNIKSSKGNGIEAYKAHGFQALNSDFTYNGANGLLVRNSQNILVSGCNLSNNGSQTGRTDGCGLVLSGSNGTIEGNTIKNNLTWGVQIDNASPIFYLNTITHNAQSVYIQNKYGTPHPNFGNVDITGSGYNDFSGNTAGINNSTLTEIKAQNNYWGYFSAGAIQNYNNDSNLTLDVVPFLISKP